MTFVETSIFTRQIQNLISDEAYRQFQQELLFNPAAGDIMRGSGGLRKIRWRAGGKGKRGGIRVIYYWYTTEKEIFLLLAYAKNEKENLSTAELKILCGLIEEKLK